MLCLKRFHLRLTGLLFNTNKIHQFRANTHSTLQPLKPHFPTMDNDKQTNFFLYNSMTKKKELFQPKEGNKVGMYVCGITTYETAHVGHALACVTFDVLYRFLHHLGYQVVFVRNFTDIDDKIITKAKELGEDAIEYSSRCIQEFLKDMKDLHCLLPTHQPRVSEHLEPIKTMISKIIDNGYAYEVDGDVYFSVEKFSNYGRLSGQNIENHQVGTRVKADSNSRKQNISDFTLWKAAKPGEPSWDSPWGLGRPGWHIECSAMSAHYLTSTFDIHGGGLDLIFPHHENEIAQSCAACSEANVKYWVHSGRFNRDGQKMSKSLGNFDSVRDVIAQYHPLALRYFLMRSHYRSSVNYSRSQFYSQLEKVSVDVYYIYQTLHDCQEAITLFEEENLPEGTNTSVKKGAVTSKELQGSLKKLQTDFMEKMTNDLHVGDFLTSSLQEAMRVLNTSLNLLKKRKQSSTIQLLSDLKNEVERFLDVLGLKSSLPYSEVLKEFREKALVRAGLREEDVQLAIDERAQARKKKDYSLSDQIRVDMVEKGIDLMDLGDKTIWRPSAGRAIN